MRTASNIEEPRKVDNDQQALALTSYIDFQPSSAIRAFGNEEEFRESWYLPNVSRDEAEKRLNGRKDGTFLIRNSVATPYALSLCCGGKVFHCQIIEEKSVAKRVGFKDTQMNFPSLTHFVRHYGSNSLKDHNKELNTTLVYPVNGELWWSYPSLWEELN